jgi:peptidoglycan/LPS O-acetylase OafA/YrhL/lysophospholipase L1-like esterase
VSTLGPVATSVAPTPEKVVVGGRPRQARVHLDGLDGLRALAITAVVVYHLDPAWLPGGFLGVDVFFVVSGFLITTLLQREALSYGRIAVRRFWVRRARRLLPALVVCVVVSLVAARIVHHDLVVGIGRQVLGALTFSTNWVEIAAGSSYFDRTAPQLFQNFWSLAVEEQFYLGWPLLVGALCLPMLARVTRLRWSLGITLGVATASTLLMATRYVPGEDATRVYYGTDTHVMGLMLGAALAFFWASPLLPRYASAWLRVRRPVLAVALIVLATLLWVLREDSTVTFRGGLAVACFTTVLLVAALLPTPTDWSSKPGTSDLESRWRTLLSAAPAMWIGRRSYGIYLWHWPVIVLIGQEMRTAPGSFQDVVRALWCVLVTVAVADLSYRFVEAPVRVWGFRECARMVKKAMRSSARGGAPRTAVACSAALAVAAVAVIATAPARTDTQQLLEDNTAIAASGPADNNTAPAPTPSSADSASPSPAATTSATPALAQDWTMPPGDQIDIVGDSLVVTTKDALNYYFPGVRQDAKSNRRWSDGLAAVRDKGTDIRRAVVLAFGTNGGVDESTLTSALDVLGPDRMVVLVNLYDPRSSWIDDANATLSTVAESRPNVIVADWNSAIQKDLSLLQSDQTHPTITGAHLLAKTVRAALAALSTEHTGQPVQLPELKAY